VTKQAGIYPACFCGVPGMGDSLAAEVRPYPDLLAISGWL